jgi:hypothetical protein
MSMVIENSTKDSTTMENTKSPVPVRLVDTKISDKNVAFNVILGFIGMAQKRGTYSLDESAKLFECVKMFEWGENKQ